MNKRSIKKIFSRYNEIPVDEEYIRSFRADFITAMKADTRIADAKEHLARRKTHAIGVRWLVPALMSLALIFTSGGTVFASQKSLPGESLYPIKLASERLTVALANNPEVKTQLQIAHAAERTKEINTVISLRKESSFTKEEAKDLSTALISFSNNLAEATIRAQELQLQGEATTSQKLSEDLSLVARHYHEALDTSADETHDESLKEHIRIASISAFDIQQIVEQEAHRGREHKKEQEEEQDISTITNTSSSVATSSLTQRGDTTPTNSIFTTQPTHSSATEAIHVEREKEENNITTIQGASAAIEKIREIEKRTEEHQKEQERKPSKENITRQTASSTIITTTTITTSSLLVTATSTPPSSAIETIREWVVEKVFKKKKEEQKKQENKEPEKIEIKEPEKTESRATSSEVKQTTTERTQITTGNTRVENKEPEKIEIKEPEKTESRATSSEVRMVEAKEEDH